MKKFCKTIFVLFICLLPVFANGQENKAKAPESVSEKSQRKSAKKKWKKERKQKKMHDKEVKEYHKKLQTKKVRKRMKGDKRKANLNNEGRREFFLIRWFSPK